MNIPKRPSYQTNMRAEIAIDGTWYSGTITTITFPAHPDAARPDVPCSLEYTIGSDNYEVEVLRYQDDIIYAKLGKSKDAQRVMIVVSDDLSSQ
jgi:hypothetical protein